MRTLIQIVVVGLVAAFSVSATPVAAEIGVIASDGRTYTLTAKRPETALIPGDERTIKPVECERVDVSWRMREKRCGVGERVIASETGISVIRSKETTSPEERVEVWLGITGLALALLALVLTLTVQTEKNRAPSKMSLGLLLWTIAAPLLVVPFTIFQVRQDLSVWYVLPAAALMFAGALSMTKSYRATVLAMFGTTIVGAVLLYLVI